MSLLKPKKRANKTSTKNQKILQKNNLQVYKNKKQFPLNALNGNNKILYKGNYFITCRSCFWYYPINDYNWYNKVNKTYVICPLCASKKVETISISTGALFRYISININ
jgi:hypothetical protein